MRHEANCVLIGDAAFLALTASLIDPDIKLAALSVQALRNSGLPQFGAGRIAVIDVPLAAHVVPGTLDAANGRAVLATLDLALEGVAAGWFDAIVTAPLQKSTINDAGVAFSGHTEYLAEKTGDAESGDDAGRRRRAKASRRCAWRWPPPTCRSRMCRPRSRATAWRRCSTSSTAT